MKAKQQADNALINTIVVGEPLRNAPADQLYVFTPNEFHTFCEQLCREQKEICFSEAEYYSEKLDEILDAPMPEL